MSGNCIHKLLTSGVYGPPTIDLLLLIVLLNYMAVYMAVYIDVCEWSGAAGPRRGRSLAHALGMCEPRRRPAAPLHSRKKQMTHEGQCVRALPKRRNLSELLTTVTDESAIAAAAKMGACSRRNGTRGERIAAGIKITL